MRKLQFAVALLFVLTIFLPVFSQTKTDYRTPQTVRRIELYLKNLEKIGFYGSVLVDVNGQTLISKGYGFRDVEQKLKNTSNTLFDIGSITKQFTAAAILKLEMQGKLSTDDKLSRFFADVPEDKREITIHDLLRHSSGLPGGIGGDYDKIGQSEFISETLNSKLRFNSGTRFSYSNVGYSLLAMIVEKVSGQSYEEYLYENLWKPAGMESTGYSRPKFDRSLIAFGYRKQDDSRWGKPNEMPWDMKAPFWHLAGNGGIISTVEELYKWDRALLSDKILTKQAKEKYYRPKLRADETRDSYYAYGWDVHKTNRNTFVIQHNGTNRIFYSDFNRYLSENTTIISLSNRADQTFTDLNLEIAKIIFEPKYKPVIPVADNTANRAFTAEIIDLTLKNGIPSAVARYRKRAKSVDLLERIINSKGYDLLNVKNTTDAIKLFELNTLAFPKSANTFDSLGEAYLEAGNKESAKVNYQKSLLLNPQNENAKEVLKRLEDK